MARSRRVIRHRGHSGSHDQPALVTQSVEGRIEAQRQNGRAMSSINKVFVLGNLGRDPEVKYTSSGAAVCTLRIATSRSWKDKNSGERVEEAEWHSVVLYDRLAEVAGQYLKKGKSVHIEGRLKTRKWTDKEGVDRYVTEIIASEMTMIGGRDSGDDAGSQRGRQQYQQGQGQGQRSAPPPSQRSQAPAPAPSAYQGGRSSASGRVPAAAGNGFEDDDIPFARLATVDDTETSKERRMRWRYG